MVIPIVQQRYDDYIALWPGDRLAKVCFSIDGDRVTVTDVTRGGQAKGTGGDMIAAAIGAHGRPRRPAHIRAMNVLHKGPTFGRSSTDLLTAVLQRAAVALGGFVTASRMGQERGKVYVEVDIRY
jgi:hypothetical protein